MVEDQVRDEVIKEKKAAQLKAELEAKMGAEIEISALAVAFSKELKSESVNFGTSNLSGYGSEPAVVGAASGLAAGQMSEVIVGERGVYVIYVASRNPSADLNDYASEQIRVESTLGNAASVQVLESLKASADIVDDRHKIF